MLCSAESVSVECTLYTFTNLQSFIFTACHIQQLVLLPIRIAGLTGTTVSVVLAGPKPSQHYAHLTLPNVSSRQQPYCCYRNTSFLYQLYTRTDVTYPYCRIEIKKTKLLYQDYFVIRTVLARRKCASPSSMRSHVHVN